MKYYGLLYSIMILLIVFPVAAETSYFDISLDCFQGCGNGIAYVDEQIMLELTIKNNFEYWVYIGDKNKWDQSASFWITAENSNLENGQNVELYQFLVGNPFYIPPKSEIEIYFPLEVYNNLEEDKKMGDWSIKSKLKPENVKYYKDPFNEETISIKSKFQIPPTITGNLLKFEAKKEIVVVENGKGLIFNTKKTIKNFFEEWTGYIIAGIIILVVGGIFLYLIKKK